MTYIFEGSNIELADFDEEIYKDHKFFKKTSQKIRDNWYFEKDLELE